MHLTGRPPSLRTGMTVNGLSKRRRDDVAGDVTLHTRVNGRRRSPERNYGDVTGDGIRHTMCERATAHSKA